MKNVSSAVLSVCLLLISTVLYAEPNSGKPIKALLVTGGCCHDYPTQKKIIPTGVSARANVKWTVVHQGGESTNAKIPLFKKKGWAAGYDVVVYNLCFANIDDPSWVNRVLAPHKSGTPAVFIHCALHTFRSLDEPIWDQAIGVRSNSHKSKKPIQVRNKQPDHFITKPIGSGWTTPNGELYKIEKVLEGTNVLATGRQVGTEDDHTAIWTNQYGPENTRMFGTSLGHHNATMADKTFLDMLTRGILWSVGKDSEEHIHSEKEEDRERLNDLLGSDGTSKDRPGVPNNRALEKEVDASSVQESRDNFARYAVDGNRQTRWCASDDSAPQWFQVKFDDLSPLQSVRIHWEKPDTAYRYRVETSADGTSWKTVVDASDNDEVEQIVNHSFDKVDAKFLRVTYLGNDSGYWGSIWELEAYSSKNPPVIQKPSASTVSPDTLNVPETFEASLYATPPEVNYPACVTATPSGHVFVGVDPQGSLGKKKGHGKILRLTDMNGDGKADRIKSFAELDHPRGLVYDRGKLWVLHPPKLTLLHDKDRDGEADQQKTLIKNVSSQWINKRGVDHAVNGIRMGIDGWIYVAVGDFGLQNTRAVDGTEIHKRGGGVIRVRPDGSNMEVHSWELRNIYDVAIDPFMNVFTRDNTNDGEGWNVRVSHLIQSGRYGYPARYRDFPEETMPPLGQYGGGSGAGALYLHDLRWPEKYNDLLLTADWGTFTVYKHRIEKTGPTFTDNQSTFMSISKPTDLDIDGTGRLFVSSWKNGKFKYKGKNVGYITQVKPKSYIPHPPEDPDELSNRELVQKLTVPSAQQRKLYQRALLDRNQSNDVKQALLNLVQNRKAPLYGRVAAVFAIKQMYGEEANPLLMDQSDRKKIKPYVLRAVTDRKGQLGNVKTDPYVNALQDPNPNVQAQALISLGRMNAQDAAEDVLPLTRRRTGALPEKEPVHAQPDAGRVIPHLAIRTLVKLHAIDPCMEAIGGPYTNGAVDVLSQFHEKQVVSGLVKRFKQTHEETVKRHILTALIRLYHRTDEWNGSWWGTTPNPEGPYANPVTWNQSSRIADFLRSTMSNASSPLKTHIRRELSRHAIQRNELTTN